MKKLLAALAISSVSLFGFTACEQEEGVETEEEVIEEEGLGETEPGVLGEEEEGVVGEEEVEEE